MNQRVDSIDGLPFDLKVYLSRQRKRVNDELRRILTPAGQDPPRLVQAMAHCVSAGGKRIRPILCIAAAEAAGDGTDRGLVGAACALELIHTYSLIHDDLPAMDDDDVRRGQPTCHIAYDEATAILAGDALLTLAFEVLTAAAETSAQPAAVWIRIIHSVARSAGYQGMIEGQMQDMAAEQVMLDPVSLQRMHELKTGALIRASVRMGGLLGGAAADQLHRLDEYSRFIGLAFQVTDDILNVEGDAERMGKATGTDENRQKSTYPAIMGLEASRDHARDLVSNALKALHDFDITAAPLRAIATYIIERNR